MKNSIDCIQDSNSFEKQSRRFIPLFLIIFIDSFGYFLVIPILIRLFIQGDTGVISKDTALATRNLLYGVTVMLAPLASLLTAPLIGIFSDKKGRKKTLLYCLIGSFIGFLLPIVGIIYKNIALILFGRFVAGAASSSQPVAQAAIADFTQSKQKAFFLSLIGFAMTLAMVLGPLTGAYLSDSRWFHGFNVMTPYWASVGLTLVSILLLLFFYHETEGEHRKAPRLSSRQYIRLLLDTLGQSKVSRLLVVFFLLEIAWSQYYQVIFLYLSERYHYSPTTLSLFTAYIGIWMSLGLTVIYRIAIRHTTIEKILWTSVILITIGFLACALIPSDWAHWIFVIFIASCVGMAYPSLLALVSDQVSSDHQGWIMGMSNTLLNLAWMITAILSAGLISIRITLPLWVTVLAMVTGMLILLFTEFPSHDTP